MSAAIDWAGPWHFTGVSDRDLAWDLAEAIRFVLIHGHYEDCLHAQQNSCNCERRRLEEAFKRYAAARPEKFEVF